MKITVFILTGLIVSLFSFCLYAKMYFWTDENGVRHYTNTPPPEKAENITETEEKKYNPAHEKQREAVEKEQENRAGIQIPIEEKTPVSTQKKIRNDTHEKVVIFTTPTCGYCTHAKKFFDKYNIVYEEYDIKSSEKAHSKFKKLNGRGVPLILIGEKRFNGYNENMLKKEFNIKTK